MSSRGWICALALIATTAACAPNGRKASPVPETTQVGRLNLLLGGGRAPVARAVSDTLVRIRLRPADPDRSSIAHLFVIDGMPMTHADMRAMEIDPTRILEIYVLKSTVAVPLYGERARDGPVVINTRRL